MRVGALRSLTCHPGRHARCTEAAHVLQTRAAHGEVADKIPDQSSKLEDGRYECEEKILKLSKESLAWRTTEVVNGGMDIAAEKMADGDGIQSRKQGQ